MSKQKYLIIFAITLGVAVFNIQNYKRGDDKEINKEVVPAAEKENSFSVASAKDAVSLPLAEDLGPLRNSEIPDPEVQTKAVLIQDLDTGKILYAKQENEKLPIASITKLMTAQIILDRVNLDDVVIMSKNAINTYGGQAFFIGEKISARNLTHAMLMASSNDAAVALAEHTSRTWEEFVALMNERARALRLATTHFANPTGLDDTENYSSAADMAIIAKESLKYPLMWEIMRIQNQVIKSSDGLHEHTLHNSNKLLGKLPNITGGKTGYTDSALETFVFVAGPPREIEKPEDNHQVLYVLLGTPIGLRFQETEKLTRWVDKAYRWE